MRKDLKEVRNYLCDYLGQEEIANRRASGENMSRMNKGIPRRPV